MFAAVRTCGLRLRPNTFPPLSTFSRREALRSLLALSSGAAFLPLFAAVVRGGGETARRRDHRADRQPADLKAARDMLATMQGRIETLLDGGKNVDGIVAAAPTRDLDAQGGKGFFNGEAFTRNAATGIMRHRQAT